LASPSRVITSAAASRIRSRVLSFTLDRLVGIHSPYVGK
jgi:hypothetical protein